MSEQFSLHVFTPDQEPSAETLDTANIELCKHEWTANASITVIV